MRMAIHHAVEQLSAECPWIVMLCPSNEVAKMAARDMAAVLPTGAIQGGRTARVGSYRISVTPAACDVFVPIKQDFKVALLGNDHPRSEVDNWITRSSGLMLLNPNQMPVRSGR